MVMTEMDSDLILIPAEVKHFAVPLVATMQLRVDSGKKMIKRRKERSERNITLIKALLLNLQIQMMGSSSPWAFPSLLDRRECKVKRGYIHCTS